MEKIRLKENASLIGFRVESFPNGIGNAFDSLMKKWPDGRQRSYYGISYFQEDTKADTIVYWAMAEEKQKGEAEKFNLSPFTLDKGDYYSVAVHGWRSKTDSIKQVFHTMMEELQTPEGTHCIEWYKTDEEMFCMIRQ